MANLRSHSISPQELVKQYVINFYQEEAALGNIEPNQMWPSEYFLVKKYFSSGGLTIDLGTGGGRTTITLSEMGFKILACDISIGMCKLLYDNCVETENPPLIYNGTANMIPVENKSVSNLLFSYNGIEYIPTNNQRYLFLKEVDRVLKNDGIAIITSQSIFATKPRLVFFKCLKQYLRVRKSDLTQVWEFGDVIINDKEYHHITNPFMFMRDIRKAGFEIIEINTHSNLVNQKTFNLLDFFTNQQVIFWVLTRQKG